eukprot:11075912-Lingulodinium_polyedra.AAC.2
MPGVSTGRPRRTEWHLGFVYTTPCTIAGISQLDRTTKQHVDRLVLMGTLIDRLILLEWRWLEWSK